MSLISWTFLFGAFAVAGPIAAHLLAKPRYRRVPFTMLRFLRSGQTQSQSRRRLRDLMVLLLRCAIIVLLAVLFARPVLMRNVTSKSGQELHFLGLDNSMSMAYTDGSERYMDTLVEAASQYIRSAPQDASFNLCLLASGAWVRDLSGPAALARLKKMDLVAGSARISDFIADLRSAIRTADENAKISALLVSDFTPNVLAGFLGVQEPVTVHSLQHRAIVPTKPVDNAAIVAAETSDISKNQLAINTTLVNYSQHEQKRRLTVNIEGKELSNIDLELAAFERRVHQVQIPLDKFGQKLYVPVELALAPHDSLDVDDVYRLGLSLPQRHTMSIVLAEAGTDDLFLLETALEALSYNGSHGDYSIRRLPRYNLRELDFGQTDVIVFSGLTEHLTATASALEMFVKDGGRAIFFMTGEPDAVCVRQLRQKGLLPAVPVTLLDERTCISPRPDDSHAQGVDAVGAQALSNYRIDKFAVNGYWHCEQPPDSICLWRYRNGAGYVYLKRLGNGVSILVNTSANGSQCSLVKSGALVAFCRYLLGQGHGAVNISFASDQKVILPCVEGDTPTVGPSRVIVSDCSGKRRLATRTGSTLTVADAGGTGWVRTVSEPVVFAGVNLPSDETDMSVPAEVDVANAVSRVFSVVGETDIAVAGGVHPKRQMPLWRMVAWILIAMLLFESAVTNRLKR